MSGEQGPGKGSADRELPYSYDLLYDIKTQEQLQHEVEYLAHRLSGIAKLCREDKRPIDEYLITMMGLPNVTITEKQNEQIRQPTRLRKH